jgi:hypothetical protein
MAVATFHQVAADGCLGSPAVRSTTDLLEIPYAFATNRLLMPEAALAENDQQPPRAAPHDVQGRGPVAAHRQQPRPRR